VILNRLSPPRQSSKLPVNKEGFFSSESSRVKFVLVAAAARLAKLRKVTPRSQIRWADRSTAILLCPFGATPRPVWEVRNSNRRSPPKGFEIGLLHSNRQVVRARSTKTLSPVPNVSDSTSKPQPSSGSSIIAPRRQGVWKAPVHRPAWHCYLIWAIEVRHPLKINVVKRLVIDSCKTPRRLSGSVTVGRRAWGDITALVSGGRSRDWWAVVGCRWLAGRGLTFLFSATTGSEIERLKILGLSHFSSRAWLEARSPWSKGPTK
jgi:hypothetical protein